jgi:hypothetical protein
LHDIGLAVAALLVSASIRGRRIAMVRSQPKQRKWLNSASPLSVRSATIANWSIGQLLIWRRIVFAIRA